MNSNEQRANAAKIGYSLYKYTGYYGATLKIFRLLYLYSIVSEANSYSRIGLEEMKSIFSLQTQFSEGGFTEETIGNALKAANKETPTFLPQTIDRAVRSYDFLFQMSKEEQKAVANAIRGIELPENDDQRWELFYAILETAGRDVTQLGGFVTPRSIAKLCNGLLNVKSSDSYIDLFAGLSVTYFSAPECKEYCGCEIDSEVCITSTMIAKLLHKANYSYLNGDSFGWIDDSEYDVVMCDCPPGIKITPSEVENTFDVFGTRDGEIASLYRAYKMLRKGGRAVFLTPTRFLTKDDKGHIEARKTILSEGLKAIVYLPSGMRTTTALPFNAVLLEKGYKGPVTFVDARESGSMDNKIQRVFDEKTIGAIVDAVISGSVSGIVPSRMVDRESLMLDEEAALNPNDFFAKKIEREFRSVSDIDADIESTMNEMMSVLKMGNK